MTKDEARRLNLHSFAAFDAYLGTKDQRPLCNNTIAVRAGYSPDGGPRPVAVMLHLREILRYYPDGRVVLQDGGYQSLTTKDRLNRFGPEGVRVVQRDWSWYVEGTGRPDSNVSVEPVPFRSGMEVQR